MPHSESLCLPHWTTATSISSTVTLSPEKKLKSKKYTQTHRKTKSINNTLRVLSHISALSQLRKSNIVHVENVTQEKKKRVVEGVFDSLFGVLGWRGTGFHCSIWLFFFLSTLTLFFVVQLPSFLFSVLIKIEFITLHSIPNPLAWVMAFSSRSFSFSLDEYSGSSSVLKQVCDVGSLKGTIDTKRDWKPSPETTSFRSAQVGPERLQGRCSKRSFCLFHGCLVPVRVGAVLDDNHVELFESADRRPVCAGGELEEQPLLILPKWVNGFPEIPADQTYYMGHFPEST